MVLAKLIEKKFKAEAVLAKIAKRQKKRKKHYCITISQETGSGGRFIAQKTAQKLGLKYYDRKLVELIAEKSREKKAFVESLDEKSRDWLSESLTALFGGKIIASSIYHRYLARVILLLAKREDCVILGRGANFLVSSQNSLRVRVIAPFKIRLGKTIEFEKLSEKEARKIMEKKHFDRKNFVSRFFGKNISNANYYDLVINTAYLTTHQAANIVSRAFRQKFPSFRKH